MNKEERYRAHAVVVPPNYMPSPHAHMTNPRDMHHVYWTLKVLSTACARTVLDVGCFDGWLDFLLIEAGHQVEGVELMPELVAGAGRYAREHNITYTVHQGFFSDVVIDHTFDAVLSYETLEHVSEEAAMSYVAKMECLSTGLILLSLPDQSHKDNPQHLWTPTERFIRDVFGRKKDYCLLYKDYGTSGIPGNWFISYHV